MIGLYPLYASNVTVESAGAVSSFLASESIMVATTFPNFLVPTPTYTTPPYVFNTSVSAPIGEIVTTGLATSTYSPLLGTLHPNATALPTMPGLVTLATVVLTDPSGSIHTSTSAIVRPSVVLGVPPGWSAANHIHNPLSMTFFAYFIILTLHTIL